ncbi:ABC transporter substrate-binding protein [Seleniivibrio sp.]|uniref:ABC transporter substrate-binding protein n=1 Tax=Seleniivibrio sp. TaxID=2898801 RepID=UPI0025FBC5B7|nr:ABC transporter substrate-binding protein [Seleniivibrio sp.]MCD8553475.1 ABC transporter substrate-binding protein [Seleniivibrio sp.]
MARLTVLVLVLLVAVSANAKNITDVLGRKVTVPEKVDRLIALGSSMTFVTYMKAQNLAVAVEDIDKRANFPKPYIYANMELVKNLPLVGKGGPVQSFNAEAIISHKPDVIFINTDDKTIPDNLQRKIRIPVVAVGYGGKSFDLKTYMRSISLTGEVLGRQKRAAEVNAYIGNIISRLNTEPAHKVSAYVGGIAYKGFQGIDSTSGNFLPFNIAKVNNLGAKAGRNSQIFVNKEFVISLSPQMVFLDGEGLAILQKQYRDDPVLFSKLPAFKNGKVFLLLPNTAYFVNPEVMLANSFMVAKAAYPEKYASLDPASEADKIFEMLDGTALYRQFEKDSGGYRRVVLSADGLKLEPLDK